MKIITKQELEKEGGLYIESAIDGTNRYPYKITRASEEEAVEELLKLSKKHALYADFYAGRLTEESLKKFKAALSGEEYKELIGLYERCRPYKGQDFIIFRPDEEELRLLVKISIRELLFSTFYITGPAVTIWSSFDSEFVLFAKDAAVLQGIGS